MSFRRISLKAAAIAFIALATATSATVDESKFSAADTIVRDVVILGGGASGSYAAIRLKDFGKTVVVIEQQNHLGGHVETYTDPTTGYPLDYGVVAYLDLPGVKDFFARFHVAIEDANPPDTSTTYVDFTTGKEVPNYPSEADEEGTAAALVKYAQLAASYQDQIFPGYFNFPDQVPEDLARPFGEFVIKYNLQAALKTMWSSINALGDVLTVPTLYVFQNFGRATLNAFEHGGFFVPASQNNSQLYAAVQDNLSTDALLSSTVCESSRDSSGVKLVIDTPSGQKLVKAKKLLVTAAPTVDNLSSLDLDSTETGVFQKWEWSSVYAAVISHTGLPDGLDILNTSPDSSTNVLNRPKGDFVSQLVSSGFPGLYKANIIGDSELSESMAKAMVLGAVNAIGNAGTLPTTKVVGFEALANHSPLQLRVSSDELKAGFIKKLYALQGRRSTFYTGAAWASDMTATVWVFTETGILPQILAGL